MDLWIPSGRLWLSRRGQDLFTGPLFLAVWQALVLEKLNNSSRIDPAREKKVEICRKAFMEWHA